MADTRILGPNGRPIRKRDLGRGIAHATLTGVRRAWAGDAIAGSLTPDRLAALLSACDQGDTRAYLTLAEEMEERDAHYRSVLGTRKRAVTRLPLSVEAASDAPEDGTLAEEIRVLVQAAGFRSMLGHCLDALGKGFAAIEIHWDTGRTPWAPRDGRDDRDRPVRAYEWRDPRWFRYDRETGRTLRLLDDTDTHDGLALPPHRFILHEPALKSGLPIRGGLARLVSIGYMAKSYTLKDWLAFAEVYGLPLRLGKYGNEANEDDIETLVTAVANIGTDAAAVVPNSMDLEFIETATGAGSDLFERLADWVDRQVSKAVLGQVASTEGSPGKLGNDGLQEEVRDDIRDADAEDLEDTLNRDLVRSYVTLNHGVRDRYPRITLRAVEPEDIEALSTALSALVPLGLRVRESEIRDKLGLAAPDEGDDILGAAPKPEPDPDPEPDTEDNDPPDTGRAANRQHECPHCRALNREQPGPPDELDLLEAEGLEDWEEQLAPLVDPVRQLAEASGSFDDFLAGLGGLGARIDSSELIRRLAEQAYKARGLGDGGDE